MAESYITSALIILRLPFCFISPRRNRAYTGTWTACVTFSMEPPTDQQSGRRSILVVDGDVQIQRLLDLSLRNAGFEVKTLATASEALTWLAGQHADLIVAETRLLGGLDGFELCRQIKQRPDGASIVFVFLSEQSVESKLRGVEVGADDFLAKPLYTQEVVAHARSLLQRRERDRLEGLAGGDERFVGDIDDLPLVDFLRAIEANRKSGVVQLVDAAGARGEIYFRDGAVVDAEVGRLSGMDAVCRLFSWGQGRFEIEWKSIRRKDVVAMEPGALLLEALRRLDEWRRLLADVPPLETTFEVDYHLLAERLAEIPDEVNAILRLFDGQRTFLQVVDDCGLSDLDALAVIAKLYREQIIRDVRARPHLAAAPGADIEGWLSEAAGPFRAPPPRARRDLFGAPPESAAGVHGRPTAPVESLEEAGREAVVDERRERFTDRLIAESAAVPNAAAAPLAAAHSAAAPLAAAHSTAAPLAAAPLAAPPARAPLLPGGTTQMGLAPAPPARAPLLPGGTTQMGLAPAPLARAPLLPGETTQQGLGLPAPALSTRPGFAAVTPPALAAPRVARNVLTELTPSVRAEPMGPVLAAADGVPQTVPPQSPEPSIVIPVAEALAAAAPASALALSALVPEQRPVAGEIMARANTQLIELAVGVEPSGKRTTDLGIGPKPALTLDLALTLGPTMAAGEVVASAARVEDVRPARKIILDPDVPEDEDASTTGSSRWTRLLGYALGMALAVAVVWVAFKKTGPRARHRASSAETAGAASSAATTPVAPPRAESQSASSGAARAGLEAGKTVAGAESQAASSHAGAAAHGSGARRVAAGSLAGPREVLDERTADPKVARALPTEFPQLLSACRQAFTEKRARDAEIACIAAKDANPDSPEACALLGHALFNRKKRREALQWAERAVELDPKHADAYVIIGGVKQAADDIAAAKVAYKKYLELAPNGQYAADLRAIVDSL
jgi:CheY-like chemotaxis protein